MVDFTGRSVGIADEMREWGQVYGEQDARAQERWRSRELRRTVDEANRHGRDLALSNQAALAQNAGEFEDMGEVLGGLRPSGAPTATRPGGAAPAGLTSDQQAGNAQLAEYMRRPATSNAALPTADVGADIATATYELRPIQLDPSTFRNPSQRSAYQRYTNRVDGIRERRHGPEPLVRALDGMVRTGVITQQQANAELSRVLRAIGQETRQITQDVTAGTAEVTNRGIRAANPGVDFSGSEYAAPGPDGAVVRIPPANQTGVVPENEEAPFNYADPPDLNPAPGGLEPPSATDTWYNGANDTSRRLQPTREMRMIEMTVRDNLRRADIAARHGRNEETERYVALALQGQAALIGQTRMTLYHAAAGGNLAAGATLLAESMGLPNEAVRIQPTDERRPRFNLQIQNDEGQWVTASETPRTRDQLLSGLQNLADASGAAARTEANTALMEATIRSQTDITVAQIGNLNAQLRAKVDYAIARMGVEARRSLEMGRGTFHTGEEGDVWFSYRDRNGNPVMDHYSLEDSEAPSTNGRGENIEVPVGRRATGIVGVGAP